MSSHDSSGAVSPTITRISSANEPDFSALLALYTESFPASERKPADELQRMLARPNYFFLVAKIDAAVIGLAIVMESAATDIALLEYLAVAPAVRGQGIGRTILRHVFKTHGATRFVLMEVESDQIDSSECEERTRRKQFYRSLGAREISGLKYLMPSVSAQLPPPMEMLVYSHAHLTQIDRESLRAWLTALYREVYGQADDDPRLAAMLSPLPEQIPVQ